MIDLHSHVLPGQDDGARTLEESLEMLRIAAASGTTDIVATAHANHQYAFDPAAVAYKLARLRDAAGPLPRIHYGCELHLTAENIAAATRSPPDYSIAQSGFLLIEFPDLQIPPNSQDILRRLIASGLRPILAHPERNPALQRNHRELKKWIDLGCAVQITAQSITGAFGAGARLAAANFLRRGLVHLVASDAHDTAHRPPALKEARGHVEDRFGAAAADLLFQANPAAILAGDAVSALPKQRWSLLW
jgi:protein-tyrosine phosphatase